jgi:putative FmdB family regulatory protein
MPTYEYRCTRCEHVFERVQKVGDPAPPCPACGRSTRKIFSSVGLIFKGSGFHTTDYRKPLPKDGDGSKPATEAAKPSAKESAPSKPGSSPTSSKDS